jgi:hypothetical protein
MSEPHHFIRKLERAPCNGEVFNPWWETDIENDIEPGAPKIRRRQLAAYFAGRFGRAKIALIGEALGYQGGHFSGIAMTSERILLGHKTDAGIDPAKVLPGIKPRRTSKLDRIALGFSEPTATNVWEALLSLASRCVRVCAVERLFLAPLRQTAGAAQQSPTDGRGVARLRRHIGGVSRVL